jgi:HEAT repeat protein
MSNRSLVTPQTPGSEQDEETARSVLDSCIEQLSTAAIGDSQWVEACQLLGQIDPAFVPMQIEALADDRYQVCRALSVALSRVGPSIFYDIIQALEHDHPNVRQFAAGLLYGLAQRGGVVIRDAIPALAAALQDPDSRVRHKAVVTLEHIGREADVAVPNLIEALSDEDDFVREWAAHALGAIGPAAEDAMPALTEALLDEEPYVRQAACEALRSC